MTKLLALMIVASATLSACVAYEGSDRYRDGYYSGDGYGGRQADRDDRNRDADRVRREHDEDRVRHERDEDQERR